MKIKKKTVCNHIIFTYSSKHFKQKQQGTWTGNFLQKKKVLYADNIIIKFRIWNAKDLLRIMHWQRIAEKA